MKLLFTEEVTNEKELEDMLNEKVPVDKFPTRLDSALLL